MKTTLALVLLGVAAVIGTVWWGGRSDAELSLALEPGAVPRAEPLTDRATGDDGPALDGRRTAVSDVPDTVLDGSVLGGRLGSTSRVPGYDLPLEAAASTAEADLARTPPVADGAAQVWTFDDTTAWNVTADGGVEVRLPLAPKDGPTAEQPWVVRVWGIEAGRPPTALGTLRFAGGAAVEGVVSIDGPSLARFDQVFVLRAAWRAEPAGFVAAAASGAFDAKDRALECPVRAAAPCTVLAWWRLEADGSLGLRRMPLAQGERVFVQGRYAALFTLE